jgi:hypothetical protein
MDENITVVPKITFEIEVELTDYRITQNKVDSLHDAVSAAISKVFTNLGMDATEVKHRIILDDFQVDDDDWDDESADFPDEDEEESAEDDY